MAAPDRVTVLTGSAPPPAPARARCSRRRVWSLRVFSAAVVISALSYTIQQATQCVHRYKLQPVLTTRLTRTSRSLPVPALTLCNPSLDGFVAEFYDNQLSKLPWEEQGNITMTKFLRQAFPPFNRSFTDCQLLGQPCAQLGVWRHRHTSGFGICSTFVPSDGVVAHQVGGGYSLQYAHNAWYAESDTLSVQEGVRLRRQDSAARRLLVFLHPSQEPFTPLPWVQQLQEMTVRPGAAARGRIQLVIERHLSRHRAPCRRRSGYSRVRCLERCLSEAELRAANASCRTVDMQAEVAMCDTAAEYTRLLERYSQVAAPAGLLLDRCHLHCPPTCEIREFQPLPVPYGYHLSDPDDSKITRIHLSFASKQVALMEQSWAYDQSALMGEIGGFVGIMLGVSVVSVMQLLQESLTKAADKLMAK